MITSESTFEEFKRFFRQHKRDLTERTLNLINKKYAHSLVKSKQRGEEFPRIFGTYKVGDITLYGLPLGLRRKKNIFIFEDMFCFLIMKDLREQKRIMVGNSSHPIVYRTHAISRYKERLGLDPEMDFVDVCKDMILSGCCLPQILVFPDEIYGTDLCKRTINIVCLKGAFLGCYSLPTKVMYAETFISLKKFGKDQQYLDVNREPSLQVWKQELESLLINGKVNTDGLKAKIRGDIPNGSLCSLEDGQIRMLSKEETKEECERLEMLSQDLLFWSLQMTYNKQKVVRKRKCEGYI